MMNEIRVDYPDKSVSMTHDEARALLREQLRGSGLADELACERRSAAEFEFHP